MQPPGLVIRRHPYEEPYHVQLEFTASNGMFAGSTDIYCNVADITNIGCGLLAFPSKAGDEYVYEYGSEDPNARLYRHFVLRAYTIDGVGHCALQFAINLNQSEPEEGVCRFSIPVEPGALNRLGKLFTVFAELRHLELQWSPISGGLYEHHQAPTA
ncbi:hypothetical protein AGMMS50256_12870 [Betaproteobacteria bacterium]|nr:hypothetical protein AGMMS50256_12870 [Betaproteobacteria bacterium]